MRRRWRRLALMSLIWVGAAATGAAQAAQCPDASTGLEDWECGNLGALMVYFVEFPNNSHIDYSPPMLSVADLLAGKPLLKELRESSSATGLRELASQLFMPESRGGNVALQKLIARMVTIQSKTVAIYLLDDQGEPLEDGGRVAKERWGVSLDSSGRYVWPSARPLKARSKLAGQLAIGEFHLSSSADAALTFVHELSHLMARTDERAHYLQVGGVDLMYGEDGSHSANELIPSLSEVFDEGVAHSFEMLLDPELEEEFFAYFDNDDDQVVVEQLSTKTKARAVSEGLDQLLLPSLIAATGANPIGTRPGAKYYRVGDIEGRFLAYNEYIIGLSLHAFVRRGLGVRRYAELLGRVADRVEQIRSEYKNTSRLSQSELAVLVEELIRSAAPKAELEAILEAEVSPQPPYTYLLPLAYLDYFTRFWARSETEFGELFEGQLSSRWVELYWENCRSDLIMKLVSDEATVTTPEGVSAVPGDREWADLARIAASLRDGAGEPR